MPIMAIYDVGDYCNDDNDSVVVIVVTIITTGTKTKLWLFPACTRDSKHFSSTKTCAKKDDVIQRNRESSR